jgi:hypothetical protein
LSLRRNREHGPKANNRQCGKRQPFHRSLQLTVRAGTS